MRPTEAHSFDPHDPIDLGNSDQVAVIADKLDVTPQDLAQAVEQVGPNPTAVAIWLGRGAEL